MVWPTHFRYRSLIFLLTAIVALSTSACGALYFFPQREWVRTPDEIGLKYENVFITTDDDLKLHGWFLPAEGQPLGSVFFLHGNGENISTHIAAVYWLPKEGYNVFLLDYRGYGQSEGLPDLPTLVEDNERVLEYLFNREEIRDRPFFVFGQSIGSVVATGTVAKTKFRKKISGLILESPPSAMRSVAREKLGQVVFTWPFQYPLSFLFPNHESPLKAIDKISPIPLLIIHGAADRVIPYHHGQRLYEKAREPKQFWRLEHGRHIAAMLRPEYQQGLVVYMKEIVKRR